MDFGRCGVSGLCNHAGHHLQHDNESGEGSSRHLSLPRGSIDAPDPRRGDWITKPGEPKRWEEPIEKGNGKELEGDEGSVRLPERVEDSMRSVGREELGPISPSPRGKPVVGGYWDSDFGSKKDWDWDAPSTSLLLRGA